MIALIVLLPLLAAIVAICVVRDPFKAKYIAIIGGLIAAMMIPLVSYGITTVPWFSVGSSVLNITISVTPLSFMLLSLVLFIGLLVLVYSAGFMDSPSDQRRFYIEMLSFEIAMAVFAVSGNFIALFIAWEFLSLTSYLLIGFWYSKESAVRAARRALTMVFIGDLALLAAIVIFWHSFGTLEFSQIIASAQQSPAGVYAGTLLLLIAVFTKSAQFPFQEWLIDAMEGPTPVSAYLHSSTMVKAGVFMVILLYPLFSLPGISIIILIFGTLTAVVSTLAATREMHIKKVIAYSTVQELSIMLVALSAGAVLAAIYFFFVQSFYKALLFFSSGVIMKSTGRENLDQVSGLGTRKLVYISTLLGALSLAGLIPFSGFFSDEGIGYALSSNLPVYAIMSGISIFTSFYIIRWFSYAAKDAKNADVEDGYIVQPRSMVYPIALLAVITLAASALFTVMGSFLSSGSYLNYLPISSGLGFSVFDGIILTVLVAIGAVLSYLVYYKHSIKASEKAIDRIIYTRYIMNWAYNLVSMITYELSSGIAAFDSYLNEAFDSVGSLTVRSGYGFRRVSVGSINSYALIFIIGMLVLFVSFYLLVII